MQMFMGRVYDPRTHTWGFSDGSGTPIPDEMMPRADAAGRISALELFRYMHDRDAHTERAQAQQKGQTP